MLDSLGIAYHSDAGMTWLEYAGRRAQPGPRAQGLGVPMPIGQEFRRHFARVEAMLDVVLDRHEERYLAMAGRLDALASVRQPGDEHASELGRQFPRDPVTMDRFFSRLESSSWIGPLRRQGFFAEPPPLAAEAEGRGWLPHWPAVRYLVRIAGQDPALAVEVAAGLPTTANPLVNLDVVRLALRVPVADALALLPRIRRDLTGSSQLVGGEAAGELYGALLRYLAVGGAADAALSLAWVLLGFAAVPAGEPAASGSTVSAATIPGSTGELGTRVSAFNYSQILQISLPSLVTLCGPAILGTLADLLDEAIARTCGAAAASGAGDLSVIWRPVIEGRPPDMGNNVKTALVSAVRDAAEQLVDDGAAIGDVLRMLDTRDRPIFRRLALHLLRRSSGQSQAAIGRRLADPATIKDPFAEREFLLLARDRFGTLDAAQQQRVLRQIDEGPDTRMWTAGYWAQLGRQPSPELAGQWVAEWTRDRLGAIGQSLPRYLRDRYSELVRQVGEPLPAQDTRAAWRLVWHAAHPAPVTGMAGWSIDRLIEIAKARPTAAKPADATSYDLATELTDAARRAPLRFSAAADRLAGLPEAYTAAILRGLRTAFDDGADLDWHGLLRLCGTMSGLHVARETGQAAGDQEGAGRSAVASTSPRSAAPAQCGAVPAPGVAAPASQPATGNSSRLPGQALPARGNMTPGMTPGSQAPRQAAPAAGNRGPAPQAPGPPGASQKAPGVPMPCDPPAMTPFRAARLEMIALLRAGLDHAPAVVPIGARDLVWQIIDRALSAVAKPGDGVADADQMPVAGRAQALATAVAYGTWVRRHDRDVGMAEVFSALDPHLDPGTEPSLTVRAVFGAEFPRLARLDRSWAEAAVGRVFPAGDAHRRQWDAAWAAYLGPRAPVSLDAFPLLTNQYQLAVDRLSEGGLPGYGMDARLGQHLITMYLTGPTAAGTGQLIDGFYQRASASARAQLTRYIGWQLLDPGATVSEAVLSRLRRLWEHRMAQASPSADRGELVRFGEWFASGRFDDDWSLRQLARVITLTGDAQPDVLVVRRLADLAPERTRLCLDIVGEWVRQLADAMWMFSAKEEYLRRILEVGQASPDMFRSNMSKEITARAIRLGHLGT